jgi:hypothetical protein
VHLKLRGFQKNTLIRDFLCCVGVMYSGEYDVCDVTLSVDTSGKL